MVCSIFVLGRLTAEADKKVSTGQESDVLFSILFDVAGQMVTLNVTNKESTILARSENKSILPFVQTIAFLGSFVKVLIS